MRQREGQTVTEYAVFIAVVAAAVVGMSTYVQRSIQANLKAVEDQINAEAVDNAASGPTPTPPPPPGPGPGPGPDPGPPEPPAPEPAAGMMEAVVAEAAAMGRSSDEDVEGQRAAGTRENHGRG